MRGAAATAAATAAAGTGGDAASAASSGDAGAPHAGGAEPTVKQPITTNIPRGQQAYFDQEARDFESILRREKILADRRKDGDLKHQHAGQNQLVREQEAALEGGFSCGQ